MSSQSMKNKVDEVPKFGCAGHRSALVNSGEGGRAKECFNVKFDH